MHRSRSLKFLWGLALLALISCSREPQMPPPPEWPPLVEVSWRAVDGWLKEDPGAALPSFLESCRKLASKDPWSKICSEAAELEEGDEASIRTFFETRFSPYRIQNRDGSLSGTITGYYVPEIEGSRERTDEFRYPVYGVPDDLLIIDLGDLYPELPKGLRGRIEGRRVVPYWERAEIDGEGRPLEGEEIFWVKNAVDLFFLHIQGSGRLRLQDGETILVSYADQNGHPYHSIGKLLLDRGVMRREQMSMQNIKKWAEEHPKDVAELLAENPRYIFFREAPVQQGPRGALGVVLTPERSLAVDPETIPLGAPVFLSTRRPDRDAPLHRLMMAQDVGAAIKGRVRADFFWGVGAQAGALAGRMKYPGKMWVLLPRGDKLARSER